MTLSGATAATLSAMGPFWTLPASFFGARPTAVGLAWINAVGYIGGKIAPWTISHLLQTKNGLLAALLSLVAVLLMGSVLAMLLYRREDAPTAPEPSIATTSPTKPS